MTKETEYPATLELAMLAVQSELTNPIKDTKNEFFKSKYATLPEIRNLVTPILAKYGLYIIQCVGYDDKHTYIATDIMHATTGKVIRSVMPLILDKQTPQGQGSAITYARRYALCAMLNIAADEDDDGNAASQGKELPKWSGKAGSNAASNALKDQPGVKEDLKDLGYDAAKEADRMSGELDLIMDQSGLDKWLTKNKRFVDTLPKELKDETRRKYAMVQTELKQQTGAF